MADWPRTYIPLDKDGRPDHGRVTVELYQHLPGRTEDLVAWTEGREITVNGGLAVQLPNGDVVGLGDFARRLPSGRLRLELADGLATRYQPAEDTG